MDYDFKTLPQRADTGSMKWAYLLKKNSLHSSDIVPFTMADMELKNPPELIADIKEYLNSAVLGYIGPTDAYFEAVSSWMLRRHNWEVSHESILQSGGVVCAIYSAISALSEEGDGVIVMPPVYGPFYDAVSRTGRQLVKCPLLYQNGRYEMDFESLSIQARKKNNKVLLLCSPHNPVGRVWTKGELTQLGRICIDNNVFIVSDEIHNDLICPGKQHTVFANISEEFAKNSIVCTSPGKSFNITGVQISNIIISNVEVRKRFICEQDKTAFYTLNAFAYKACESAYNHCERWLDALIVHIFNNHRLLKEFLNENLPKIKPLPLEGTFLQWIDFTQMGLDSAQLDKLLRESAQVHLNPGYIFGVEGENFARMNIAAPSDVLLSALERMAQVFG